MKITIVGFGNIAHAIVAFVGNKSNIQLSVLSSSDICANTILLDGDKTQTGYIELISNKPEEVIPNSDMIIFAVPSHIRMGWIRKIRPYITEGTILGAFPGIGGFYDEVINEVGNGVEIFASQRVPYITRVVEKGKVVRAYPKDIINIVVFKNKKTIQKLLEDIFDIRINLLDTFMEVHLSNSNPILHSARLYSLLQRKQYPFKTEMLFYEEWDDSASSVLLRMDEEFMFLVKKLQLRNILSLYKHYGVNSIEEMTNKLRTIEAFSNIKVPLVSFEDGYEFDISSRYFQEDIGHDLAYIIEIAKKHNIDMPTINKVYLVLKKIMDQ